MNTTLREQNKSEVFQQVENYFQGKATQKQFYIDQDLSIVRYRYWHRRSKEELVQSGVTHSG